MTTVNLREASRITGINVSTLKRHIDLGILDATQDHKGCRYHISILELENYTFYIWMNRNKLKGLRMYNPFDHFFNLKKIVLGSRAKR